MIEMYSISDIKFHGNLHLSVYPFFKKKSPQRHGDTEKIYENSVSPCLCGEKYLKKCQLFLGINEGCQFHVLIFLKCGFFKMYCINMYCINICCEFIYPEIYKDELRV